MFENERRETDKKREIFRVARFTRRQFLKRVGFAALGTAVASIGMTAACKTTTGTTGTATASNTTPGEPTTSNIPATSSTVPASTPATSSATVTTSTPPTSTTSATGTTVAAGYNYVPPTTAPQIILIAGTTCSVATDRSYSTDHVWVKTLSANIVVLGITTTMVETISNPYNISLPAVGTTVVKDNLFGDAEGTKMNVDLISPVSGKVLQVNEIINSLVKQSAVLTPVIQDPYNSGWLFVAQLSHPVELNDLVSPQKYADLVTKKY